MAHPLIKLTNVSKSFHGKRVLSHVNLMIEPGKSIVIVGLSGSGKSVLLNLMIGFLEPDEGTVEVYEQDWQEITSEECQQLRQKFGMVFQDAALFDGLTIEENIALPLEIHAKPGIKEKVESLLKEVKLTQSAYNKPAELSGGMRKRAGIARALAVAPDILLYDEPTTGLDGATAALISDLIHTVNTRHKYVTAITVTHDYLCAAMVADRILYLDKETGRLEEWTEKLNAIKSSYQNKEECQKKNRDWLEDAFKNKKTDEHEEAASRVKFRLIPYVKDGISEGIRLIGRLCALFFQMGFPLRKKDLLHRVFALGVHSFPMILAASFFVGMIGMMQFYEGIPDSLRGFLEDMGKPLPATLSVVLLKILSPLLVGILLAGRVGSNISAEIGTKQLMKQIDALESLAIPPTRFLLAPIVLGLVMTVPVMSLLSTWAGNLGGYLIWISYGQSAVSYWTVGLAAIRGTDILYVLSKSVVMGMIIGLVSYQKGIEPKKSAEDIANATTNAVLIASLFIVIFDFFASSLYTALVGG